MPWSTYVQIKRLETSKLFSYILQCLPGLHASKSGPKVRGIRVRANRLLQKNSQSEALVLTYQLPRSTSNKNIKYAWVLTTTNIVEVELWLVSTSVWVLAGCKQAQYAISWEYESTEYG
jgi:hypothetical protein